MTLSLVLQNLFSACIQGLMIALAAVGVARLLPVDRPRFGLAFWQVALLLVVAGPWIVPERLAASGRIELVALAERTLLPASTAGVGALTVSEVAAAVLGLGLLIRAARLLAGLWRLRGFRRRAVALELRHPALADAPGHGSSVEYLVSSEVCGPGTFGVFRPAVLLPRAFLSMPVGRQRAVLAHERTHVLRRDWLINLLEEALGCVFWFHPALPLLLGRIRLCREQRVDELVVGADVKRQDYLESLLEMAGHAVRERALPASLLLEERHLRARVELLLKEVVMSRTKVLSHLGAWVLVVGVSGAGAAAAFPVFLGVESLPTQEDESRAAREPRLVHKVDPVYPEDAKRDKIEGSVILEIQVGGDGAVSAARVKSGHKSLGEAAVAAVRQWRWEPILGPDGKPAEVAMTITVNFRLS